MRISVLKSYLLALPLAVSTSLLVAAEPPRLIPPPDDLLIQHPDGTARPNLVEAGAYLRVAQARSTYGVDGTGLSCAVLDTGLRVTHNDFMGRVATIRNFTTDDGGNVNIVTDGNGHGTNVCGIVAANGPHVGFAPGANIIPVKVLSNSGGGTYQWLADALDWVIANRTAYDITCVNMSLGFGTNDTTDTGYASDAIRLKLQTLRNARVAVIIAAGNSFYSFGSAQGMAYPAVCRESISVGAIYDANIGSVSYGSGATAFSTAAGRICPFSQRLHPTINSSCRTDILSTGAALTSAGNTSDTASSTMHGTSQAAPTVAGLVLLAQQLHLKNTGQLPTVDQLETWLRASTFTNVDGDDEDDNVANTGLTFIEADALELLGQVPGPPPSSANVTSAYSGGNLILTGDSGINKITLNYSKTAVTVIPVTGTTLDGGTSSKTFTLGKRQKHSLRFTGGAGNDQLVVNSASLESCAVYLGDGNDACAMNYCKPKSVYIDGGTNTDTLTTTGSKLPKRKTTIVNIP